MITFEIKSERENTFQYSCYKPHRRGRKACRDWFYNGKKYFEDYYIDGKLQSYKSWNEQGKPL